MKATTSEYWQWVFKGAEDAGKQLGVKIDKLGTPKDDAAGQIGVLESAAGSKPMAIVISPTIFEALGDPISAVTDAGIPVIVINSGAKTDKYASFLTTNNEAGGKAAAEAMAACVKERTGKAAGKVGYLTAMAGHESLDSRDKGFVEGMKAYPDITVVGNRVANNEEAEGMNLTADMLTKDPDLVGLFADNAQMGTGAGASINEQKLGDKFCLVAFNSDAGELEHLKDGSIYALIIQDPIHDGLRRGLVRLCRRPWRKAAEERRYGRRHGDESHHGRPEARRPARCLEASAGRVRRQLVLPCSLPAGISRIPGRAFIDGFLR